MTCTAVRLVLLLVAQVALGAAPPAGPGGRGRRAGDATWEAARVERLVVARAEATAPASGRPDAGGAARPEASGALATTPASGRADAGGGPRPEASRAEATALASGRPDAGSVARPDASRAQATAPASGRPDAGDAARPDASRAQATAPASGRPDAGSGPRPQASPTQAAAPASGRPDAGGGPRPQASRTQATAPAAPASADGGATTAASAAVDAGVLWSPAAASAFPPAVREALADAVREARALSPDTGLSVAVLHAESAWLDAFGAASLKPARKATAATSYRVGSITKTFTAAAVLKLAEEGRLSLDADIRTLVPSYPEKPWPVTVRHLLGHTAGVGWYRGVKDAWTTKPTTTAQALALFKDRPLVHEPGADYVYSSFGYVLLGAAIERVTGTPYAAHLEQSLWGPLGLSRTGLEASRKAARDRAAGYRLAKGQVVPARHLDLSSRFSSGGLRSTAEDLARWAHALLAGDVLAPDTWRAMTTPGVTSAGEVTDYGLGFAAYPVRGRKVVAHAGGVPGAAALLVLIPEEDFAVVLLSNLQNTAAGQMDLAMHLAEVVLDDGVRRRRWYAEVLADEVAFDGMARVWSHGLVRFRDEAPPDAASPADAFAALAALFSPARLAADPAGARTALREAYFARNGRVSAVVGAEMARVLEDRGALLHEYGRRRGAAGFFADYARACAETECAHPLPADLAALAQRLDAAWQGTPPALWTQSAAGLDEATRPTVLARLEGLSGHVDLVDELTHLAWRQRAAGKVDSSRATLQQSARLHPASPLAVLALAEAAVLDGDGAGATRHLEAALALPRGPAVLSRELVKARAEALQVGAKPPAVAALDAWVKQARALLPATTAAALQQATRAGGPTQPAPNGSGGDGEGDSAQGFSAPSGAPPLRLDPRVGRRTPDGGVQAVVTDGGVKAVATDGGVKAITTDGGVTRSSADGGR